MVSRDMYSIAVGMTLERMIFGTASIAVFIPGKGTSRLTEDFGRGSSFSTELFLTTLEPNCTTSPLGRTAVSART